MAWNEAISLEGLGQCEDWNGTEDPWPPDKIGADTFDERTFEHHDEIFNDHSPDDGSSPTSTATIQTVTKTMMYPEVEAPIDAGRSSLSAMNGPYFTLQVPSSPLPQNSYQTMDTMPSTATTSKRTIPQVLRCQNDYLPDRDDNVREAASMTQARDPLVVDSTDTTDKLPSDIAPSNDQRDESPDAEDSNLYGQYGSKYELRPQGKLASKSFTSTWIDQDDTGNYDPDEEERQLRAKRSQLKLRRRVDSVFDPASEASSNGSEERAPREPLRLIVQLPLKTASGRLALRSILNKPPARHEPKYDDFGTGYPLRSKAITTIEPKQSRNAQHGLPEDLTGHPLARGCWGCLEPGKDDCTLLEDEHDWPCHGCLDSGSECELIIPPTVKRACESCKRRRRTCSYTFTNDHDERCFDCAGDGFHCVAGPTKESIRSRIRYNAPPPVKKPPSAKVYWTCTQCQDAGRNCSFTSNGQSSPDCTACEMNGVICIPKQSDSKPQSGKQEAARKAEERRRKRVRPSDIEQEEQLPSKRSKTGQDDHEPQAKHSLVPEHFDENLTVPQRGPQDHKQHSHKQRATYDQPPPKALQPPKGKTRRITTRFSHPILFNNTTAAANGICDFCDGSSFAVLGLEPKDVEVIDWQDGRGLTEVRGGHMGEGTPSTRMCTVCTMHRCNIITCRGHSLRKVPNADRLLQGASAALAGLFNGVVKKKDKWCSLCPSLASYECETGTVDSLGQPCLGCGLLLCETCMVYLGVEDGDLETMLAGMEHGPSEERPLGVRADFELLKADGLLMRYMMWLSEHEEV